VNIVLSEREQDLRKEVYPLDLGNRTQDTNGGEVLFQIPIRRSGGPKGDF